MVPLPEDDSLTTLTILYPFSDQKDLMHYCVHVCRSDNLGDVLLALAKELLADNKEDENAMTTEEMKTTGCAKP